MRLVIAIAGGTSVIPGQGTKIPDAAHHSQKDKSKKKERKND